MTVTLETIAPDKRDEDRDARVITLPDGQTFDLLVGHPTYEQMLADMTNNRRDAWKDRIEAVVYGWRDISVTAKDGTSVPLGFSRDNFALLCQRYPTVFAQAVGHVGDAFMGTVPDATEKNSAGPSEPTSADGQAETTNHSDSSTGTPNGEASPDYSEHSD